MRNPKRDKKNMLNRKGSISAARLKTIISETLKSGDATLRSAAARLGTSPRSLQRQLELQEITYSDVVDEVRYEIARTLLVNTDLGIAGVGATLGYRDPSSFSRAFMRWSGTCPRDYRGSHAARGRSWLERGDDLDHAVGHDGVIQLSARSPRS